MQTMSYYHNLNDSCYEKQENPLILPQKSIIAHFNSIYDLIWTDSSTKIVTSSSDQSCAVFDVQTSQTLYKYYQDLSSVKCVREIGNQGKVFTSGGRNGCIHIWDIRQQTLASITPLNQNSDYQMAHRMHIFNSVDPQAKMKNKNQ